MARRCTDADLRKTHIATRAGYTMGRDVTLVREHARCGVTRREFPTAKIAISRGQAGKQPCAVCLADWRREHGEAKTP